MKAIKAALWISALLLLLATAGYFLGMIRPLTVDRGRTLAHVDDFQLETIFATPMRRQPTSIYIFNEFKEFEPVFQAIESNMNEYLRSEKFREDLFAAAPADSALRRHWQTAAGAMNPAIMSGYTGGFRLTISLPVYSAASFNWNTLNWVHIDTPTSYYLHRDELYDSAFVYPDPPSSARNRNDKMLDALHALLQSRFQTALQEAETEYLQTHNNQPPTHH